MYFTQRSKYIPLTVTVLSEKERFHQWSCLYTVTLDNIKTESILMLLPVIILDARLCLSVEPIQAAAGPKYMHLVLPLCNKRSFTTRAQVTLLQMVEFPAVPALGQNSMRDLAVPPGLGPPCLAA